MDGSLENALGAIKFSQATTFSRKRQRLNTSDVSVIYMNNSVYISFC